MTRTGSKAFMSDQDARTRSGGYGWREAAGLLDPHETKMANAEHTRAALAEAERILAETEPIVPCRDTFGCGRTSAAEHSSIGPLAMCHEPYKALAESLANALASWPESDSNDEDRRIGAMSKEPSYLRSLPKEDRQCSLCDCPPTGSVFGFPVCAYHNGAGEDDPPCPECAGPEEDARPGSRDDASPGRLAGDLAYAARLLQEVAGQPKAIREAYLLGALAGVGSLSLKACLLTAWGG